MRVMVEYEPYSPTGNILQGMLYISSDEKCGLSQVELCWIDLDARFTVEPFLSFFFIHLQDKVWP